MSLTSVASSPFVAALGLTLLHFLWQGAAIAAFLAATLASVERRAAEARFTAASAALVLMAASPVATFVVLWTSRGAGSLPAVAADARALALSAPPPGGAASLWPACVVLAWLVGVLFMSARFAVGLARLSALLRRPTTPAPDALRARFDRLARRLGVPRRVRLLTSERVDVPMVIGVLRPVILVPLSALTSLPPSYLTALLAHELAHVRRLDFLTNALQTAVVSALFYHPAVHWVAGVARRERENCCDDAAAAAVGDPIHYARALAALEGARARLPELALGSNGGPLMQRIRRLIDGNAHVTPTSRALTAPALVLASSLTVAVTVATLVACSGEPPAAKEASARASTGAPRESAALSIPWLPPSLKRWEPTINAAARDNGVDPDAIAIVTLVESCGDASAKSPSGALGLMQLMPATAAAIQRERGALAASDALLLDPAKNLDLGAFYFGKQLGAFGEQGADRAVELAAAAYNGGPGRVRDWLSGKASLSEETERYRTLVAGLWGERRAARSTTYDAWRERVRERTSSRSSHPLPGARITLKFGELTPGASGAPHEGVDLAAPPGTPVYAALDGTLDRIEANAKGEDVLVLKHTSGIETRYRHLAKIKPAIGAPVARGDELGVVGEPSGGPHVHFEVRDNGEAIEPDRYLRATAERDHEPAR